MTDDVIKIQNLKINYDEIPANPGCYMYKNSLGKVLYVGKAKNLRNRVSSYFKNFAMLERRIQKMLRVAVEIQLIKVDTEIEALILETNLIKKYRPKYNVLMRDDKNYSWVKFEKPKRNVNDFPRIKIVRDKEEDGAEYFGPYPSNTPLKNILKRIRRTFPYASCNRRLVQKSTDPLFVDTNNSNPCLYFHLGLCSAPCASLQDKEDYLKNFNNIKKFFRGEKVSIMQELERQMRDASKNMDFELAANFRDKINDIKYATANISIDNEVDDVVITEHQKNIRDKAIKELIEHLNFPEDKLFNHEKFRIECYDISNIQGTNATGSMVVLIDGEIAPKLYRKFRIRTKDEPDDFTMMKEVLGRRLLRLLETDSDKIDESFIQKPDLIIVDGGKGQLSVAYEVLKILNLDMEIPIVGLAKKQEEIFKIKHQFDPQNKSLVENRFERILLPRKTESLYMVQRIRDEAHRFAKNYHKKLRTKNFIK